MPLDIRLHKGPVLVVSLIIPAEKQYPLVRLNTRIELIPVLQIIQHIRHRYG